MKFLIFLSILLTIVSGQAIFDRPCDLTKETIINFDVNKYLGRWYELMRYDQPFQKDGDCSNAVYTLNDNNYVNVNNSQIILPNGDRTFSLGRAYISYPDHIPLEGKLNVTFGDFPPNYSNYWILDTDYTHYTIVWSCRDIGNGKSAEGAWVLSRTSTIDNSVEDVINKIIDKNFDRSQLRITNQNSNDCKYE